MMAKFQRFGGAMFTPVVFFVFSGIVVGLTSVFLNADIMGGIAAAGTPWTVFWTVVDTGGWTVFNNMEVLFVIGLPLGLADHGKERAALEAFVLYMTFNNFVNSILSMFGKTFGVNLASTSETSGLKVIAGVKTLDTGVVGAILIAAVVVYLHNKFFDKKLPDWLGVFQGSAFVAMIGFFAMLPMALIFCWGWPYFQRGVTSIQQFLTTAGDLGVFIYIFLEKALLPVGLHHFIYAPFQYGPAIVNGGTTLYWMKHITVFAASKQSLISLYPQGGFALQGLSNIFGVPGIAAAFYATAKPENRTKLLALIIPGVMTSVFAGITEPFDYTFLFIAPALFFLHAFLAACLATTMYVFGVTGEFCGGLIDFIAKNYIPMWANHWTTYVVQWAIGLVFMMIYFLIFRFLILKFDLPTPGRAEGVVNMFSKADFKAKQAAGKSDDGKQHSAFYDSAAAYVEFLGGVDNIASVTNCFTRLRVEVNDPQLVAPDQNFMAVGASGVVRKGTAVQVIVGTDVTNVREEVDDIMENGEGVTTTQTVHESQKVEVKDTATETTLFTPVKGQFMNLEDVPDDVFSKKMVGEGFAMNPEDGNIFAGVEGTVMTVFPTKHALGIHTENGAEVMIHLGLDTVELNGDPFDVKVKEGDHVHKDTPVATMDLKKVQDAGKNPVVLMIITNAADYMLGNFKINQGDVVNAEVPALEISKVKTK